MFPKWVKCKFDQDNNYKGFILDNNNNNNKWSLINLQNHGFTVFLINVLTQRITCSFLSGYPNSCLYKKYIWIICVLVLLCFFYWKYIFSSGINLEIDFHEMYPGCVHIMCCSAPTLLWKGKRAKENLKVHIYGLE